MKQGKTQLPRQFKQFPVPPYPCFTQRGENIAGKETYPRIKIRYHRLSINISMKICRWHRQAEPGKYPVKLPNVHGREVGRLSRKSGKRKMSGRVLYDQRIAIQ